MMLSETLPEPQRQSPAAPRWSAFEGERRIASGDPVDVALATRDAVARGAEQVLVFDDHTGRVVDLDLRGSDDDVRGCVLARLESAAEHRGPGRPRLGVVAREVTLLPRHWAWLGAQPGGASAALRRLVDQARKGSERADRVRRAQDASFRFMSAMGGDLPGYEEAIRALFAGDRERFDAHTAGWPADVRDHSRSLAGDALREAAAGAAAQTREAKATGVDERTDEAR